MNKTELDTFTLELARHGRTILVERAGEFAQTAFIVNKDGARNVVLFRDAPRGQALADVLRKLADLFGGIAEVDALAIQCDARFKVVTREEYEKHHGTDHAGKIADNPANPECLVTAARSREHSALAVSFYCRKRVGKKTEIAFRDPDPQMMDGEMFVLPNLWSHLQ